MMNPRLVEYMEALGADVACLRDWKITTAQRAGVDTVVVLVRGPEIHILPLVDGHALSRRNIREYLAPIIERFGYCTTRVPLAEHNHRLRLALGFTQQWSDEYFSYWTLTSLPYEKTRSMKEEAEPCL